MISKHVRFRGIDLVTYGLSLIAVFSAHIAQSAEHFLGKEEVTGSIPIMGSIVKTLHQVISVLHLLPS